MHTLRLHERSQSRKLLVMEWEIPSSLMRPLAPTLAIVQTPKRGRGGQKLMIMYVSCTYDHKGPVGPGLASSAALAGKT